jgi:hypothetical protein
MDCPRAQRWPTEAERQVRQMIERIAEASIRFLDEYGGDADFEPDDGRELDEDFEPTLGWNERDAPKDLWITDGGMAVDGDDD